MSALSTGWGEGVVAEVGAAAQGEAVDGDVDAVAGVGADEGARGGGGVEGDVLRADDADQAGGREVDDRVGGAVVGLVGGAAVGDGQLGRGDVGAEHRWGEGVVACRAAAEDDAVDRERLVGAGVLAVERGRGSGCVEVDVVRDHDAVERGARVVHGRDVVAVIRLVLGDGADDRQILRIDGELAVDVADGVVVETRARRRTRGDPCTAARSPGWSKPCRRCRERPCRPSRR